MKIPSKTKPNVGAGLAAEDVGGESPDILNDRKDRMIKHQAQLIFYTCHLKTSS